MATVASSSKPSSMSITVAAWCKSSGKDWTSGQACDVHASRSKEIRIQVGFEFVLHVDGVHGVTEPTAQ